MTSSADSENDLSWLRGTRVLVAGGRVSGQATIEPLVALGAVVTVADSTLDFAQRCAELGADMVTTTSIEDAPDSITEYGLVVTSPGFRPDAPILAAAAGHGIPIWGDVEFSWRVDHSGHFGGPRKWLVVTGTNGKTTTTSMLASILDAAGVVGRACGNIGLPILDALAETSPRVEYLAVELSSFQLHWAPSVRPDAGVVLNVAEDHLDWHGGMSAYAEAKSRALSGKVAVVGLDDAIASELGTRATADIVTGFRLGEPGEGELGVEAGHLVDNAFGDHVRLAEAASIDPPARQASWTRWPLPLWRGHSDSRPTSSNAVWPHTRSAHTEGPWSVVSGPLCTSTIPRPPIRTQPGRRYSRTTASSGLQAVCSRAQASSSW